MNALVAPVPRKRVLVVSPHFPPVNAPDMQRVRMSLPYFREFGWEPVVLAVAPSEDCDIDQLLQATVPDDIAVHRVDPVPLTLARRFGVGNIVLRSLPGLYRAGARLIANHAIDLVFFSTTMFFAMPLGRMWRSRFGVPYVLDMQDPWLSDYYREHPESTPPPKYSLVRRIHAVLEPWTMSRVSGVIAVSDGYVEVLRRRYPRLTAGMCATLPFAASTRDVELITRQPQPNRSFAVRPGTVRGVYVGRAGDDMKASLRILFTALRAGMMSDPAAFSAIMLHFVGTDYAADGRARRTVAPVAREAGVEAVVDEQTGRVRYFEALQLMRDADFLILIGSDDPAYTASKVYPYLMAGKPILAIVHCRSGLVPLLREAGSGEVVTFSDDDHQTAAGLLLTAWKRMLGRLDAPAGVNPTVIERHSAREMTRRQCSLFDRVLDGQIGSAARLAEVEHA